MELAMILAVLLLLAFVLLYWPQRGTRSPFDLMVVLILMLLLFGGVR